MGVPLPERYRMAASQVKSFVCTFKKDYSLDTSYVACGVLRGASASLFDALLVERSVSSSLFEVLEVAETRHSHVAAADFLRKYVGTRAAEVTPLATLWLQTWMAEGWGEFEVHLCPDDAL